MQVVRRHGFFPIVTRISKGAAVFTISKFFIRSTPPDVIDFTTNGGIKFVQVMRYAPSESASLNAVPVPPSANTVIGPRGIVTGTSVPSVRVARSKGGTAFGAFPSSTER